MLLPLLLNNLLSGASAPAAAVVARAVSGRRRHFLEFEGRLYECAPSEIDGLLAKLRAELDKDLKEEKKDRRELKILIKRKDEASLEGTLFKKLETRIEKVEQRLDNRLQRISELMDLIAIGMEREDEDEEEELLLLT